MKKGFYVMTPHMAVFGQDSAEDDLPQLDGFPFHISEGNITQEGTENETGKEDIMMPRDPLYGELEDLSSGAIDIDDLVFTGGEVRKSGAQSGDQPVIHPPKEPNFGGSVS